MRTILLLSAWPGSARCWWDGLKPKKKRSKRKSRNCALTHNSMEATSRKGLIGELNKRAQAGHGLTDGQPWNPLLLEWDVKFHLVGGEQSNLSVHERVYRPDFTKQTFHLGQDQVDLLPTMLCETATASIYRGSSILTPRAQLDLGNRIDAYLEKQLLAAYQLEHLDAPGNHEFFQRNRAEIIAWYHGLAPVCVAMLIDLRGKLHATRCILPTKAISLPTDQFMPALQTIEISFLVAPVLSPRPSTLDVLRVNLPLPPETGYDWHWVERQIDSLERENWSETDKIGPVD